MWEADMDPSTIDLIVDRHGGEPGSLIQILLDIQCENRWLPREALERVAERLNVPQSRVQHVATFYKAFSVVPRGRHEVRVCMGTACHVRGARRVLDAVQDHTGIKPGETDRKLNFSLETVNCLGCCALGPVVEIDGKVHGRMSPASVAEELKKYRSRRSKVESPWRLKCRQRPRCGWIRPARWSGSGAS